MEMCGDMVVKGIVEMGENIVESKDDTEEAAQVMTVGFYKCA